MTLTMTSRAARTERTRASIVDAALALFTQHGYRAVSLRDIAAEAGISHPALLKHFRGKEELLACVLERFEDDTTLTTLPDIARGSTDDLPFSMVARSNAEAPGYLPLFASLIGEASAAGHPAHETMRERAAGIGPLGAAMIEAAQGEGVVGDDRDPAAESVRLMAAWDALQVVAQYLPERADVVDALERHEELLAFPVGWRSPDEPPAGAGAVPVYTPLASAPRVETGYRAGRARRQRIIEDAMTLFGREGYGDTPLRDIAERVGVSKSALYHHFPSKDALLLAVLEERDRRIDATATAAADATGADLLRALPDGAEANERDAPGLVEVYAVISCEAVPESHPAHAYFAHRFASALDGFESMFRAAAAAGDLPAHRDPSHEALWLLALWDGLQYQWLYDRGGVDIGGQLRAHLDDVLPR
ncbi:TetR/AcrR family transcriptional regulator [Microbacterium gilvum]|uniref:HTH tetR-type domain-containing protein n=1 Tax=Microbacterium gilvum TaxID=1336204 RepID=A0ABP9AR06_9MICO